jgi:signal peptidase I
MKPLTSSLDNLDALKCELASETLRSSGKLRLRVTGWSMLPTVWPGDTLLLDRVSSEHVSEGDVVLFGRDRRLFAHRVVAKGAVDRTQTITQGDGMPQPDLPVSDSELLGKVSFIIRNGRSIEPSKTLRISERAVAALVRRSESAARVVVGVHNLRHSSEDRVSPCQS